MSAIHPEAQKFLDERVRFGVVTTLRKDGSAGSVPVWYDWDGTTVRFFSGATVAKLKRLQRDSRITLTVSGEADESPPKWVSFEGRATISREGAKDLAVELAQRYLGDAPTKPHDQQMKATFEAMSEKYVRLVEFVPERGYCMLGDDRVVDLFKTG